MKKGKIGFLGYVVRPMLPLVVIIGFSFLFAPVCAAAAKGEIELKLVSMQPVNFSLNHYVKDFVEKLNARGAGKVKVNFLGGPEISSQFESVKLCSKGVFDLVYSTSTFYAGLIPESLSYLLVVASPTQLREIGYVDYLDQLHRQRAGVKLLGFLWGGEQFSLYSKKPFDSLEALKGAVVRSVPMFEGFIKGIEAKPVTLSNPEMYEALQRGVVDAVPIPKGHLAFQTRLYEVSDYIIYPTIPYVARAVLMANEKKWNSLPQDVKDLITEIIVGMEPEVYNFCLSEAEQFEDKLVDQGMKIVEMKPADVSQYHHIAVEGAWDTLLKQCPETAPKLRKMLEPLIN